MSQGIPNADIVAASIARVLVVPNQVDVIAEFFFQHLGIIALGAIVHHNDLVVGVRYLLERLQALDGVLESVPVQDYDGDPRVMGDV
jgi:hypothetical protein